MPRSSKSLFILKMGIFEAKNFPGEITRQENINILSQQTYVYYDPYKPFFRHRKNWGFLVTKIRLHGTTFIENSE